MKEIFEMSREQLLALEPDVVTKPLSLDEMLHIARNLGAFWSYDYEAQMAGRPGMHALLKSGRHSDGFFVSRILLKPENIRRIIASQMILQLQKVRVPHPEYVIGVPDGATLLGEMIAEMLGVPCAVMNKHDGRLFLNTELRSRASVLILEDFCTRGTGFKEAVIEVRSSHLSNGAWVLSYNPVIINRGGIREIVIEGVGVFKILSVVERKINDWDPTVLCPLCALGSFPIKPNA